MRNRQMKCRHCEQPLERVFVDLGFAPPSNAFLSADDLCRPEIYYPLKLYICNQCWLVQTEDHARADELFHPDYPYFSSFSKCWLDHSARYVEMIRERLNITSKSLVIEIAANDGYLLKNFVSAGIPCLGIEPTECTADAAEESGVPIIREFFCNAIAQRLVEEGCRAELVIGNNVYAHVPDINDFTNGLKTVLRPGGTITLEFPHLLRLIEGIQFDTIYHEHYSYLSLYTAKHIFENAGLRIYDVEELPTHGGSIRIYGCHAIDSRQTSSSVDEMIALEEKNGLRNIITYETFQHHIEQAIDNLVAFLIDQKKKGKTVAAYGAAAKGNTLLNYAGIRPDMLQFVCDASSFKQGKYLPGRHIPVVSPKALRDKKPDYVLITAWNLIDEIIEQCNFIREWGGRFVVAIPTLQVLP